MATKIFLKQHPNHWFNYKKYLKKFFADSVQKLFRLSYPFISNCASGVEKCSTVTF